MKSNRVHKLLSKKYFILIYHIVLLLIFLIFWWIYYDDSVILTNSTTNYTEVSFLSTISENISEFHFILQLSFFPMLIFFGLCTEIHSQTKYIYNLNTLNFVLKSNYLHKSSWYLFNFFENYPSFMKLIAFFVILPVIPLSLINIILNITYNHFDYFENIQLISTFILAFFSVLLFPLILILIRKKAEKHLLKIKVELLESKLNQDSNVSFEY